MSDLLCIPLKQSSGDVHFTASLKELISKNYKNAKKEVYEEAILDLDLLRGQVMAVKRDDNCYTKEHIDLYYRYYDQLLFLEKRFKILELQNNKFSWDNALAKETKVHQSIAYEKACILFNIGALCSHLGNKSFLAGTDDELKSAAKWLQTGASVFSQIKTSIATSLILGHTLDIHSDSLSALSQLMLAQAQEVFVAKTIKDQMKDQIIAKLCKTASEMFGEALTLMTNSNVKHLFKNWHSNMSGKQFAYIALSQFFQSQYCLQEKMFGEQIGRLGVCIENLKKAQDKTGNKSLFSFYMTEASRLYIETKKDNDFIYHEPIPKPDDLKIIQTSPGTKLVKLIELPEYFTTEPIDIFLVLDKSPEESTCKKESALDKAKKILHVKPFKSNKSPEPEKVEETTVKDKGDEPATSSISEEPSKSGATGADGQSSSNWLGQSLSAMNYIYQTGKEIYLSSQEKAQQKQ